MIHERKALGLISLWYHIRGKTKVKLLICGQKIYKFIWPGFELSVIPRDPCVYITFLESRLLNRFYFVCSKNAITCITKSVISSNLSVSQPSIGDSSLAHEIEIELLFGNRVWFFPLLFYRVSWIVHTVLVRKDKIASICLVFFLVDYLPSLLF